MTLLDPVARRLTQQLPIKPVQNRLDAPLASLTFDDFPRSAWTTGGEILSARGLKATYYVSGGFSGQTEDGIEYYGDDDLIAVAAAGHEVGCHTFSHDRVSALGDVALIGDVDRNAAYIRTLLGDYQLSSFAYPYGDASLRTKRLFGRRFPTSRGIGRGINRGLMDLSQLRAIGLESAWWTPKYIEATVRRARRAGGWLIFFTHDVSDHPTPYGATPQMLAHALDLLNDAQIEILPVKHALARTLFI